LGKDYGITSQCSVFSESEVVTLINEGTEVVDIAAGVNNAVAGRLNSMVRKVGLVEDVALTDLSFRVPSLRTSPLHKHRDVRSIIT